MKISELFSLCRKQFRDAGFDSPGTESAYLLEEAAALRPGTASFDDTELTPEQLSTAQEFLRRRLAGEPFQYIYGWTPFREIELKVGPGCLIPRPETEVLVDHILKSLPENASVCELGAGSGAVCLSLAFERKDIQICASEYSPDAIVWALKNRFLLNLERVRILPGDLYSPFTGETFDVIAANLPYIAESERDSLPLNVRGFEPDMALFAPDDGFALIHRAIREGRHYLKENGELWFEIGETQGDRCLESAGDYSFAEILNDQYGVPRFFHAKI